MGLIGKLKTAITPSCDRAVGYRCLDCDRRFVYRADLSDPDCPYCDSEALERAERP